MDIPETSWWITATIWFPKILPNAKIGSTALKQAIILIPTCTTYSLYLTSIAATPKVGHITADTNNGVAIWTSIMNIGKMPTETSDKHPLGSE